MPRNSPHSTLLSIVITPLLAVIVWIANVGLAAGQTPAVGRFAYVGNADGALTTYVIDATTGRLTPRGYTAGLIDPAGLVFEPSGRFGYSVIRDGGSVVVSYTVDAASGALTQLPASAVISGPQRSSAIATESTGHFIYVTGENANQVRAYSINQTSGVLTSLGDFSTGMGPVAIAVTPNGRFAYVANEASDDVSIYTIEANGELREFVGGRIAAGDGPRSIAMDSQGRFVFVANANSSSVSAYAINATSGALTATGTVNLRGLNPARAVVDPGAKFVYVANTGSNDLSVLSIDPSSGALAELGGSPVATHNSPVGISIDASGKFAYVAHSSREVATFVIDNVNGTLHALSNSTIARAGVSPSFIATTQGPNPVVLKPQFAYIANAQSGRVSGFSVNPSSGVLQSLLGSPFTAGASPRSVTTDLRGRFAYVTRDGANNRLAGLKITAGRLTTSVPGSPFLTGADPKSVRIEPSTRFLYVLNKGVAPAPGTVSGYNISAADGSLTPMQSAPGVAGLLPESLVIDPLGLFLYVANTNENTISAFRIDALDGHLTPVVGSPFPTIDLSPKSIDILPSGRYLYTANSGNGASGSVSAYGVDQFTGELKRVAGSPFRVDDGETALAADPLGRFIFVASTSSIIRSLTIDPENGAPVFTSQIAGFADPSSITVDPSGKFLYVTGEQSHSVRAFTIDAAGTLKTILAPSSSAPASMAITATMQ